MDDLYLNALKRLRKPAIKAFQGFSVDWQYKIFEVPQEQSLPVKTAVSLTESDTVIGEKKQLMESFTQFSAEKLADVPVFKFDGGEIAQNFSGEYEGYKPASLTEYQSKLAEFLSQQQIAMRIGQKNLQADSNIKVLFISDIFLEPDETNTDPVMDELLCFFDEAVAQLFQKIVAAMGLDFNQYIVSAISTQKNEQEILKDLLLSEILFLQPEFIVTLGARAFNEFLGAEKRLKSIHGQFFDLHFKDQHAKINSAKLMPLFSPKLLHMAPNMKKTAWKDIQNLMEKF